MSTTEIFPAVRACAILLLGGVVLHASDVTAGNGKIIDWRTVKSGDTIQEGADSFDTAQLFVALVGPEAAMVAATRDQDVEPPPPDPKVAPRVFAFMANERGCRLRQFEVGDLRIRVEVLPWLDGDDDAAAAFTERLAALAAAL